MGLRINTNITSVNARRNLSLVTEQLSTSFRRLSTGLRIATAADDAAGLALSERLRSLIRSSAQARRNANDGISLVQVGEGALNEVSSILIRMRELAIQANTDTVSGDDKDTLDAEFQALIEEIDRIALSTKFNGVNLLDGSTTDVTFQIGVGTTANVDTITVTLEPILGSILGIDSINISSVGSITGAMTIIDSALDLVSETRGALGATLNRLQSTIKNLGVSEENLTAAESRIRDVDVAEETANLTRNTILQQAAISVLSQANVQPQIALNLLQ